MTTKLYWMGEDIDTLPAEKLREIIILQHRRIGDAHNMMFKIVKISREAREAKAKAKHQS